MSNFNEAAPLPNQVTRRSGLPFIIAPTGSVATNAALTLGTALPTTYGNAYTFLPAGAVYSGSVAGWYFTQYSSTTVGVVFQNVYVGPGIPVVPSAPIAIVAAGPGAYTGVTSAVNGPSAVLPSGTLGGAAELTVDSLVSVPNNANNKTVSIVVGATILNSQVLTTVLSARMNTVLMNRGNQFTNVAQASSAAVAGTSTATALFTTIDFRVNQFCGMQGTLATATDYIVFEYLNVASGVN